MARSRPAENEQTHTRFHAFVRRSTAGSGAIAATSFTSRLNRTSGHAPSRSSSRGIGSLPSMSALESCAWVSWDTRPGTPVTRSRVRS